MTKCKIKRRTRLKTYNVGYYLEQGFAINVKAQSADDAERIIRKRLDDECCELPGSTRVHYDDGMVGAEEVCS